MKADCKTCIKNGKCKAQVNSATNLQPNQKQAINQFLSVGNQYNGALINIGLSNIEKLQNVS